MSDDDAARVDPRTEADAQVAHAFEIVVRRGPEDPSACTDPDLAHGPSDYTPGDLDKLFFSLSMALIQLAKLPGGREARDRSYAATRGELVRRGKHRMADEAEFSREALDLVRRAFGDDVDLGPGTSARRLAKLVEAELAHLDAVRGDLLKLATAIRPPNKITPGELGARFGAVPEEKP